MNNAMPSLAEIQKKMERYCAYQERCHQEVLLKLQRMKVYGNQNDTVVSYLIEQNYLNETRFAEHFVRGKFKIKKWGKNRLVRALKQRNISDWNIKNAMNEISDDAYSECAETLAEKFWTSHQEKPLTIRKKKVWEAMQYRGWETAIIMNNILRLEYHKE